MKKALLSIILSLFCLPAIGQCILGDPQGTFDNTSVDYDCIFSRDTVTDTNNIWQVGHPNKSVFNVAASGSRAMVTDTSYTYPPNDTSAFTFMHEVGSATLDWHWHVLEGNYFVNTDTLTDHGTIEFSPDNGTTWIDLFHDTLGMTNWSFGGGPKPVFSGNSSGWKHFRCQLNFSGTPYVFHYNDTVKYRFTFISDTIDTHKDGLMFDDIFISDVAEDVPMHAMTQNNIHLFPNPANDKLFLRGDVTSSRNISITNCIGAVIAQYPNPLTNEIDIHTLPPGMYLLRYTDAQTNEVHKFSIQR